MKNNFLSHIKDKSELKVTLILLSVPVILTILVYYGTSGSFQNRFFIEFIRKLNPKYFYPSASSGFHLYPHIFWSISCFLLFFLLPVLIIKLAFSVLDGSACGGKEKLSDYGLRFINCFKYPGWLAGVFYLLILPFIIWVSYSPDFQKVYPFYPLAGRSLKDFLWFESFYMLQFFALEFFFRGYFLFGLKKRFSEIESILIMTIPYCMIHYGKPFPEAIASIGAGIILGWLALRTKSIFPGLLLHCAVALSMDISALIQKNIFFGWL